jgi:hypothetical protein
MVMDRFTNPSEISPVDSGTYNSAPPHMVWLALLAEKLSVVFLSFVNIERMKLAQLIARLAFVAVT